MSGTFVDTNVLLDLVTDDKDWADWAERQLDAASISGALLIDDIVYAELSVRFAAIEALDEFIRLAGLALTPMPRAALFLAAKAFQTYRTSGGVRTGVLPDFFIGAHAAVERLPLLTRDVQRYRSYFPKLALIAP
jgi:predicted nucleic acid-binding protein